MRIGGKGNRRKEVRQGSGDTIPITGNYVLGGPFRPESIEEDRGDME